MSNLKILFSSELSSVFHIFICVYQALLGLKNKRIKERTPGEQILENKTDITVTCKSGWTGDNCDSCVPGFTGDNCDSCAPNFGPPGSCDSCLTGFAGDNCDVCGFGFSTESNCTECIQNGLWTGKVDDKNLTVRLTFSGANCSTVAPGKFTNATHTMIVC